MEYWKHGQQKILAVALNMSQSHLNDILHRRKSVSTYKAEELSNACKEILGLDIPWQAFVRNKTTFHNAFYGEPIK